MTFCESLGYFVSLCDSSEIEAQYSGIFSHCQSLQRFQTTMTGSRCDLQSKQMTSDDTPLTLTRVWRLHGLNIRQFLAEDGSCLSWFRWENRRNRLVSPDAMTDKRWSRKRDVWDLIISAQEKQLQSRTLQHLGSASASSVLIDWKIRTSRKNLRNESANLRKINNLANSMITSSSSSRR